MPRKLLAEWLGTFFLVFIGTGAAVVDSVSGGAVTHLGVALAFGLVVGIMIYLLGDLSGAHMNPAVSAGLVLAGRFPARDLIPYAAAQCLGALAASGLLRLIFPTHPTLGATLPTGGDIPSFLFEMILTCLLVFAVLAVTHETREPGLPVGIILGGLIALEALFGGPISGASMNPARSLGPALVSGQTGGLWIYFAAPLAGAAVGVGLHAALRGCGKNASAPR